MKKEELQKEFSRIAEAKDTAPHKDIETRHQVLLTELYVKLLNEFNESTTKYNFRLIALTVVLSFLTLIMTIKMFIP